LDIWVGGKSMRSTLWMAWCVGAFTCALSGPAAAQPGHAPFTFAPFEIDDFERTLVPAGVEGATILNPGASPALSHRAVVANGNMPTPYVTGAPLFLETSHSAYAQFGGILGTVDGGPATPLNFNDMFPGGVTVSPGGYPNGGPPRNSPAALTSYNGTKISLVSKSDANTADDVGITSGNQALRVSMWNASQGDGDTSFDRPAMLVIKANDFWGIADSRFDTWEMVRDNPGEFNVSIDVTVLANEVPDTFAPQFGPYLRLGFISGHAGLFDEGPPDVLQGPDSLLFNNGDDDGDTLPNFSDPEFVDPENSAGLPGTGVPGVIQRRYVFPASAMSFPAAPLANAPDNGNRHDSGGVANAYMLGFVFNGNWTITTPTTTDGVADGTFGDPVSFTQHHASFIVDNMRFIPRNPVDNADFNDDGVLNAADWQILIANLNGLVPPDKTFAMGDIGSHPLEPAVSPGVVDFEDFVRFEEIWDANNGGAGAFRAFLAGQGVPEPSAVVLLTLGLASLSLGRRRRARQVSTIIIAIAAASWCGTASAQLADTLLFGFEPPPDPNLQRWQPAGDAANQATPPMLTTSATGATQGSTRGLSITQTDSGFSWNAAVSIFGGDEGLPDQQAAFDNALDIGANHFVLEMDVTYRDDDIPPTSFVNVAVRLSAGSTSSDEVHSLATAGDGTGPVPDQVIPVSIPLSIVPADTADDVLSLPNQSSLAGFYNLTLGFNGDWGPGPATFHVDNIRLRQVTQPPLLTLEVDRATGAAMLRNVAGPNSGSGPVTFDYYEIASEGGSNVADYNDNGMVDAADYVLWRDTQGQNVDAGTGADGNADGMITTADYDLWRANFGSSGSNPSLNAAGWKSLDAQNVDAVDGTDAGSVAGDSLLEGWDRSGSPSSAVLSEAFLVGGSTWDENESRSLGNIFTLGGSETLTIRYREPDRPGFLRTGLVTYVGGGAGAAATTAVPEPTAAILAGVAGVWLYGWTVLQRAGVRVSCSLSIV
jgi:hypothetical protein